MTVRLARDEGQGHPLPMPHRFLRSLAVCWSSRSSLLLCPIMHRCSPAAAGSFQKSPAHSSRAPAVWPHCGPRGLPGGGRDHSCFRALYRSRGADANAEEAETGRIAFSGRVRPVRAVRVAGAWHRRRPGASRARDARCGGVVAPDSGQGRALPEGRRTMRRASSAIVKPGTVMFRRTLAPRPQRTICRREPQA